MKVLLVVSALTFLGAIAVYVAARVAKRPVNVGQASGVLAPCAKRPNCVSSRTDDPQHALPPIPFSGPVAEARARIATIVRNLAGATVVTQTDDYLYAEFRSRIFGFVDDVEFRFDGTPGVIHFRSASRIGRSDFGVNRRRIERIRAAFLAP